MGVAEGSPLRDLGQILYLAPSPPTQTQADVADKEETTSMRELVQAIDAHADPEASNNLYMVDNEQSQQLWIEDIPSQPTGEAAQPPPANPII